MQELAVYLGFAVSLAGFLSVLIKVGTLKGEITKQLKHHDDKIDDIEGDVARLEREVHGIEREHTGFMSEMNTSLRYITETLARLERKIDGGK